jgi:hypothetical protein
MGLCSTPHAPHVLDSKPHGRNAIQSQSMPQADCSASGGWPCPIENQIGNPPGKSIRDRARPAPKRHIPPPAVSRNTRAHRIILDKFWIKSGQIPGARLLPRA